ncbi:MAG: endonuclease/exonuclease/phosphatase family protein [Aestuariivirga sp.]|nr:endonuclease/exonuclease/phosphatase family protein [Aestuariivirga sp.]
MIWRQLFLSTALLTLLAGSAQAEAQRVTLLSFNMWGAGANEQKPIDETVAVIKASGADIIGVQETVPEPDPCTADVCAATGNSRAKDVAAALGYHYHEFEHNTDNHWADAVISRFPFGKETPNGVGVEIDMNGRKVVAYSMNLDDAPYQPYQLLNIEYGDSPFLRTADETIKAASETRGKALALLLADIKSMTDAGAQFVMGDFNEPSHLDWTEKAAAAGRHPLAVEYPTTKAVEAEGFVDTFRVAFPDEMAKPGVTWTPTSEPTDPEDHHDRIDFVFAKAKNLKVISAGIVGEKAPEADLVVTPWPSDHRASMAVVEF